MSTKHWLLAITVIATLAGRAVFNTARRHLQRARPNYDPIIEWRHVPNFKEQ